MSDNLRAALESLNGHIGYNDNEDEEGTFGDINNPIDGFTISGLYDDGLFDDAVLRLLGESHLTDFEYIDVSAPGLTTTRFWPAFVSNGYTICFSDEEEQMGFQDDVWYEITLTPAEQDPGPQPEFDQNVYAVEMATGDGSEIGAINVGNREDGIILNPSGMLSGQTVAGVVDIDSTGGVEVVLLLQGTIPSGTFTIFGPGLESQTVEWNAFDTVGGVNVTAFNNSNEELLGLEEDKWHAIYVVEGSQAPEVNIHSGTFDGGNLVGVRDGEFGTIDEPVSNFDIYQVVDNNSLGSGLIGLYGNHSQFSSLFITIVGLGTFKVDFDEVINVPSSGDVTIFRLGDGLFGLEDDTSYIVLNIETFEPVILPPVRIAPGSIIISPLELEATDAPMPLTISGEMVFAAFSSSGLGYLHSDLDPILNGFKRFNPGSIRIVPLSIEVFDEEPDPFMVGDILFPTFSMEGELTFGWEGSGELEFPSFTIDAVLVNPLVVEGSLSFVPFTINAEMEMDIDHPASAELVFPNFKIDAEGIVSPHGEVDLTFPVFVINADGLMPIVVTDADLVFPTFGIDAEAWRPIFVEGDVLFPHFVVNAEAWRTITIEGPTVFPIFEMGGLAGVDASLEANLIFPVFGMSGLGARPYFIDANFTLPAFGMQGLLSHQFSLQGDMLFPTFTMFGSSVERKRRRGSAFVGWGIWVS